MTLLSGRISTLVVYQLPKLRRRVRFPYPALYDGREKNSQSDLAVLFLFHAQETRRHGCLRVSWLAAADCAPRVGLEPTTPRLTAECSTIELSRIIWGTCSVYLYYNMPSLARIMHPQDSFIPAVPRTDASCTSRSPPRSSGPPASAPERY